MTKAVYACDGVTYEFPVTFGVDHPTQLYAFLEFANGNTKELIRNQDYVYRTHDSVLVTRVDDDREPWPEGVTLTVMRDMSISQPTGRAAVSPKAFWNRVQSLHRALEMLKEHADRCLHVGVAYPYLFRASQPYGLIMDAELSHPVMALSGGVLRDQPQWSEETDHAPVMATGGDLYDPLVYYLYWPTDGTDHDNLTVVDGDLFTPTALQYLDWPTEETDHGYTTVVDGDMYAPMVYYLDWPADEADHTLAVTAGTLV